MVIDMQKPRGGCVNCGEPEVIREDSEWVCSSCRTRRELPKSVAELTAGGRAQAAESMARLMGILRTQPQLSPAEQMCQRIRRTEEKRERALRAARSVKPGGAFGIF
jgi:hypothetical protein